ncbi:MAG: hypothetical protein ACHQNT_08385 [Bacteroidia bacterium]
MPKRKIPGAFTPRIIEALDWMSKDCSYKLAGNKMGIGEEGIKSLMRKGRDISGLHCMSAMLRKAVEDGEIVIEVKRKPSMAHFVLECPFEFPPFRFL